MFTRRFFVKALVLSGLTAGGLLAVNHTARADSNVVEVWKDPNCGCCEQWVEHLQQNGFKVKIRHADHAGRSRLGMPQSFASCHTAKIGNYLFEGHIPAEDIKKFLADKPQALGLAVPGMPLGSPGMDGEAYGNQKMPYQVLSVEHNGKSSTFAVH